MFLITQWNAHNPSDKQLIHAGFFKIKDQLKNSN